MAFFDELGKKISSVGQGAIEKTKNATSSAKINSSISEENKLITECFKQIGELYYRNYKTSENPDIQHQIDLIIHAEQNIENHQRQLLEIRGVTICPICDREIPIGASFCSNCGYKMPETVNNTQTEKHGFNCPKCNAITNENLNFCTNCGAKLHEEDFDNEKNQNNEDAVDWYKLIINNKGDCYVLSFMW